MCLHVACAFLKTTKVGTAVQMLGHFYQLRTDFVQKNCSQHMLMYHLKTVQTHDAMVWIHWSHGQWEVNVQTWRQCKGCTPVHHCTLLTKDFCCLLLHTSIPRIRLALDLSWRAFEGEPSNIICLFCGFAFFMSPPLGGRGIMFSGCPYVRKYVHKYGWTNTSFTWYLKND